MLGEGGAKEPSLTPDSNKLTGYACKGVGVGVGVGVLVGCIVGFGVFIGSGLEGFCKQYDTYNSDK